MARPNVIQTEVPPFALFFMSLFDPANLNLFVCLYLFSYFPEFLPNCTSYGGPHTLLCYENIWLNVGCLARGSSWSALLEQDELSLLNSLTLR